MNTAEAACDALDTVVAAMPGGGELRHGQRQMCDAVANALDQDRHLVVAAGTGTGKSMAYLAPLAVSGRKAVRSSARAASGTGRPRSCESTYPEPQPYWPRAPAG